MERFSWILQLRKGAPAVFKWTLWTIHGAPLPPPSKSTAPAPGKLTASSSAEPDKSVTLPVITMGETLEKIGQPVNTALMEEMTSITRGRMVKRKYSDSSKK
ncbi:MAG: hypothetical protein ACLT8E_05935 [Akkermansia sp.]